MAGISSTVSSHSKRNTSPRHLPKEARKKAEAELKIGIDCEHIPL
jgi:hypothetical protein